MIYNRVVGLLEVSRSASWTFEKVWQEAVKVCLGFGPVKRVSKCVEVKHFGTLLEHDRFWQVSKTNVDSTARFWGVGWTSIDSCEWRLLAGLMTQCREENLTQKISFASNCSASLFYMVLFRFFCARG